MITQWLISYPYSVGSDESTQMDKDSFYWCWGARCAKKNIHLKRHKVRNACYSMPVDVNREITITLLLF